MCQIDCLNIKQIHFIEVKCYLLVSCLYFVRLERIEHRYPNHDSNSSTYGYDILRIIHRYLHAHRTQFINHKIHAHPYLTCAGSLYRLQLFTIMIHVFVSGTKNSYTSQRALSTILSVHYFNAPEVSQSYAKSHGKSE